jgi:hypothetical protein
LAIELATAYYTLIPSMAGTAAAVQTGLGATAVTGAFSQGGVKGGAAMGAGVGAGLSRTIPLIAGAFAAIGIADFFGDAIDAASDLNESGNAIRVSFGLAADEIERLGETASDRIGLSQTDFNSAAVRFSSFAEDLAKDGRSVSDVIDQLTTRGADFASVYNIEVAQALEIFQSGLSGEAEPLKRFGINLLDSSVSAYAYANGIAEVGTQLDQTQKLEARYGLLLQETAKVQGDFANTSDQLANKQRINAANLQDALARIGTALLPAATAFAEFLGSDANAARLERLVDAFIRAEPSISAVADFLLDIAETKFGELDTLLGFFAALEDGKITAEETLEIVQAMPQAMRDLALGIASFYTGILNAWADLANGFTANLAAQINAIRRLLGIPGTVAFGTVRFNLPSFSSAGKKKFPGQASGGQTLGAGWSWVGEKGPELLHMPVGATVVPLDKAGGVGQDLRPLLIRLIEEVAAKRIMVADGQVLAETAQSGFAQQTSLGAA